MQAVSTPVVTTFRRLLRSSTMKNHLIVLTIVLISGCVHKGSTGSQSSVAVNRNESAIKGRTDFDLADVNQDSVVSEQEYEDAFAAAFARLDKDGDRYLGGQEIPEAFKKADANTDSKLSIYEYMNAVGEQYRKIKKKNSYLTRDEASSLSIPQ